MTRKEAERLVERGVATREDENTIVFVKTGARLRHRPDLPGLPTT